MWRPPGPACRRARLARRARPRGGACTPCTAPQRARLRRPRLLARVLEYYKQLFERVQSNLCDTCDVMYGPTLGRTNKVQMYFFVRTLKITVVPNNNTSYQNLVSNKDNSWNTCTKAKEITEAVSTHNTENQFNKLRIPEWAIQGIETGTSSNRQCYPFWATEVIKDETLLCRDYTSFDTKATERKTSNTVKVWGTLDQ